MQKRFLLLFTCTIFGLTVVAQKKNNSNNSQIESKLWQTIERLHKAIFETKDSVVLRNLVHDKVTYGHSSGVIEDKIAMISKAVTNPTSYKDLSQQKLSLTFFKNMVVARLTLRATSIEKSIESSLDLSILQVWIKAKGNWQIVARQAVKVAPK